MRLAAALAAGCASLALRPADAAEVSIRARSLQPGEAAVAVVTGLPGGPPSGAIDGQALDFYPSGKAWLALLGFDLEASTGTHRLSVDALGKDIELLPKKFPERRLKVPPGYVELSPKNEDRAERESGRIKSVLAGRSPEPLFVSGFRPPLPVAPVTGGTAGLRPARPPLARKAGARFGERRFFNDRPRSPHGGADLAAPAGTPVRAPADGVVALTGDFFFHGKLVILDHGLGLFTEYGHLSKILVREGERVKQGRIIGKVGATGRATGPHLHWAAKLRGSRVDPFSLVSLDFR